uniref:Arf-GAP domain-containing protein n=1 Tax=Electrophorus electricus TaxID=8005 RepID=A0A4W4GXM5_ELEEL
TCSRMEGPSVCVCVYPQWASVNRAVLICDQCCSVHRSLGRHSSQVRHLTHTAWPPTQLQMVQTLYNNGANSIWEHSLLDPASAMGSRRKTAVYDKLHPNKAEFIKAKYQMLAFVHRIPCRDEDLLAARDLSKQLHSSVRTGNLETTLRLLSLGAHANFFHPEKGTTPLHVAVKAGQVSQAELLGVYGADPGAPDVNGKTPIDYAREVGHMDLAERLVEIQYELTDGLAFYLCGRKPDHRNGQHFIIPQLADSPCYFVCACVTWVQLSNRLFEELAMDVYDEVDRRETDAVWHTTQTHSALATAAAVPFLPVNPEYSSTRNQGRQKLARFNAHEFATLVVDILSDAWRRQLGNSCAVLKDGLTAKRRSDRSGSDSQDPEQPDYDSVASDEDAPGGRASRAKHLDPDVSDGPVSVREFLEVKGALAASEAKIQQLTKMNTTMSKELRVMQEKISKADKKSSVSEGDYDNTVNDSELEHSGVGGKRLQGEEVQSREAEPMPALPTTEEVIQKTEQITKNIQELLRAAQQDQHDSFVSWAERIHVAVSSMVALFPQDPGSAAARAALRSLVGGARRLRDECRGACRPDRTDLPADPLLLTQQVIQCAYEIAKAAKQLVSITTKENGY